MRTDDFYDFITERERIRLLRAEGKPWPWTKDKILGAWKFTNVQRHHDATSAALINEFYRPHYGDDRKLVLLNAGIARYFGTVEFMRAVGWQNGFNSTRLIDTARKRLQAKERVFTGAYIITNNGISGPKEEVVVNVFLADLWRQADAIVAEARHGWRWHDMMQRLAAVRGFGGSGFMAKEVVLDTRYTGFWPPNTPTDKNTWTPVGPGSMRGAARVLLPSTPKVSTKLTPAAPDVTRQVCRDLFERRKDHWPKDWVQLELHDIQFQLCEFDKYERVRLGEGTPRSRYHHEGAEEAAE